MDYKNNRNEFLDFHIIFSDKVKKQEIDNFLRNVEANVGGTEKKLAGLEKDDFDEAVVNFDQLLECLEKESLKLREYLLGFLSRGMAVLNVSFLKKVVAMRLSIKKLLISRIF